MVREEQTMQECFAEVGKNCHIDLPFYTNWGWNIHVGDNLYVNHNCIVADDAEVYIGNEVMIARDVTIIAGCCVEKESQGEIQWLPVHIGNRVWIGAGTTILPGVTIGEGTVIRAGSVVTESIPADVIAAGNPCRVIRRIVQEERQ